MSAYLEKEAANQTDLLKEVLQVLRSINDKTPTTIPGQILELESPAIPVVVDQIPVRFMSSNKILGRAQVTEDGVVHFEVKSGDLLDIIENLISLNQVVVFDLAITYQNETVQR